jgi:hypothetical protein
MRRNEILNDDIINCEVGWIPDDDDALWLSGLRVSPTQTKHKGRGPHPRPFEFGLPYGNSLKQDRSSHAPVW